jgi:hypothetical protein
VGQFNDLLRLSNPPLISDVDFENKKGTMFILCSNPRERAMLRTFVEEAAALASIALFVGMIAVWAQLIPQLWSSGWGAGEKRDAGLESPVPRGQLGAEASPSAGESAFEVAMPPQADDRSRPMIQRPAAM